MTDTSTATNSSGGSLARFIFWSYALTWIFLAPFFYLLNIQYGGEMQSWMWAIVPIALLGGWGPSLAGILVTARTEGRSGVAELLRSLLRWRVPAIWYLVVFVFPPAVAAVSVLFVDGGVGSFRLLDPGVALAAIPFAYLLALPFGPLGEEIGWRGYALPRLIDRHGAVWASLILGVIWTFWHLPMMLLAPGASIPSVMGLSVFSVAVYLVQTTSVTVLITLLFLKTRGSLFLAVLAHMTFNTAEAVVYGGLPEPSAAHQRTFYLVNVAILAAVAAVVLAYLGINRGGRGEE